tara:strand:- start:155 stop:496 length:342 start_codon:yes stop_codon:yes gene_type:complete
MKRKGGFDYLNTRNIQTMIDAIEQQTSMLKMLLIGLGFELTPPLQSQKNKIKQMNQEFQEIATLLVGTCAPNLFDNVRQVVGAITARYCFVLSLHDVLKQTRHMNRYIQAYIQ